MIDWLKKRLSPVKKDSSRWKELAEAIQEFWAENFDPDYNVLAGLRSIYTADVTNQKRFLVEMGHYFEDGIAEENIPVSIAMRKMELHQKETDVPLVRSMARIGFVAEWAPLYAPRGNIYGTAFYTEDELEAAGLHIDAEVIRLDGSWHIGDDPAVHLTLDSVYMTSRAKMIIDLSGGRAPGMIDVARRRIMQIKPLHIVFDGFKYRIWFEISAIPSHEMRLRMMKAVDQHYPWCTPKLTGLWRVGTNITIPHRHLDGTWKLNGVNLGHYLVSGIVHKQLLQCTITSSMTLIKNIERPDKYSNTQLGESLLKLDGLWHVGMNRVLTLSGDRKLRKGPIEVDAAPAWSFGTADACTIQYPVSPKKLGQLATLVSWRRLDGRWTVGGQLGLKKTILNGTWGLSTPGIKTEQSLALAKNLGNIGLFRNIGRYTVRVGEGWSRRLDGRWAVGAYHDLDGTWSLDGSHRLGAIRIGRYFRKLDMSWKVGEATKRLDGTWRVGQPGPECEMAFAVRKAA
jgi:hypothetical protein